eukprot:TRINITY_DN58095_c0_g1_i1.p1 TRINITY_DN58095_c0_g1~~TRINITY_DN58095_c0_g1_i1.p1  ORF type:complete len:444 (+),score=70.21 TRINITY_DN58095_c0_g1_i1:101-1432(+)
MAGKQALSFGFSKKAQPKRVVEALVQKKTDDREAILGLDGGKVEVDGIVQEEKRLSILCKNPLQVAPKRKQASAPSQADASADKTSGLLPELRGGLVTKHLSSLSDADAEATRELLREAGIEASGGADGPGLSIPCQVPRDVVAGKSGLVDRSVPILMKDGSKKARDASSAPEASKDMFDKIPVECFGEALLRGMGYNPSENTTKFVFHEKPRSNLLGLGAKAVLPHEAAAAAKKRAAAAAAGAAVPATSCNASDTSERAVASIHSLAHEPTAASTQKSDSLTDAVSVDADSKIPASDSSGSTLVSVDRPADSCEKRRRVEATCWPSRGLVVRIIGDKGQLRAFYGAEAVVLDVDNAGGCCRIKARPPSEPNSKSSVLPGVLVTDLETRVSRDCQEVRIVKGSKRGHVAKLIKRDVKRGLAQVSFESCKEMELPLDSICQFVA